MNHEKKPDQSNKILLVDDEPAVLSALKREFMGSDFSIVTAESGFEALKILEKEKVGIILSDYKMPGMDGVELLLKVRDQHPSVYRAILSGYIEEATVFRALVKGIASIYFTKPWNGCELVARIKHILSIREKLNEDRVVEIVNSIKKLPTLPEVYQEFMSAIEKDRPISEIAVSIEKDVGLSVRILQIVNSAFFPTAKITQIERAIIYLGLNTVKDIVLFAALYGESEWTSWQLHNLELIYLHSLLVHSGIRFIYENCLQEKIPESLASTGLLHDIGKIIVLKHFPDRYKDILTYQADHPDCDFYDAEIALGYAGGTHSELGAYFCDYWNLPEVIIETVMYHHVPENSADSSKNYMSAFCFVNKFVNLIQVGVDLDNMSSDLLTGSPVSFMELRGLVETLNEVSNARKQ